MSLWQGIFVGPGVVLELVGLTLTGFGLYYTWHDNAAGERLRPAMRRELGDLLRRLFRRPRPAVVAAGTAHATVNVSAFGFGTAGLPAEASVDEKLEQLKREVDAASARAAKAEHDAAETRRQLAESTRRLDQQLRGLRDEVAGKLRDHTLNGLPLAVFGLALAVTGAALQFIGAFLPG